MTTFALIINQKSGKQEKEDLINTIKNFLQERGVPSADISTYFPTSADETIVLTKEACTKGSDIIIPLGGDGTIKLVCAGIYESQSSARLGIIPTGTVNNFARALGIPLNTQKALETLFTGRTKDVDLAKVNNQYMISSLTLGLMADMALSVTPEKKRRYGVFAFIKAGWKIFLRRRSYHISLIADHKRQDFKTKLLLITMSNTIAGLPAFNPQNTVNDGLFTVYTLRRIHFLRFFLYFFFRIGKFNAFKHWDSFQASDLRLVNLRKRDKNNPNVRVDGDNIGKLPILVQMLPKAIEVIVPEEKS
ncbi:diacylglycerol kinase family lipid kinase [Streptococcus suis]|nr:diacylglycerol kinase family lipid kinase [Streptococcus suis]